jgi:hypothetical protein
MEEDLEGALQHPSATLINTSDDTSNELKSWLTTRSIHLLQFFAFHPLTPPPVVSELLEARFFSSAIFKHPFDVMSTVDVRNSLDVRMPDPAFSRFSRTYLFYQKRFLSMHQ